MGVLYRTTGVWGVGLGRNLTAPEVDGNFYDHEIRIDDLETSRPQPDNFASVSTSGTLMTLYLQSGTALGPVQLPTLMWRWRGEWLPFTIYAALDTFSVVGQGIFLALFDHTSAATFDPNATAGSPATAIYQQLIGIGTNASIADLNDVAVTTPADGDFLAWSASASEWTNRTKTAATALLDVLAGDAGSGGTKGLAPAPAAGDAAAGKVLAASGNYVDPATMPATRAGDATLVAGTVTVTNTTVTASTRILLSRKTAAGTLGNLTYTVSAGVSFTITSTSGTDTSTVSYMLVEVF